jgi:hypothetical protein
MTLPRGMVALLFFATLFIASNMWTRIYAQRHVAGIDPPLVVDTTSVLDGHARKLHTRRDGWAEPRVDLNGNEIDDAVGDYRIDGRGEMYERHAPDTALLRLGAPTL